MEEYKDVMLSEPPSRFAAAPAVQSMSLENYKGILLCDRPTATGKQAQGDAGPAPFLPAGKGDDRYTGLQPSMEQRSRYEASRSMRQSTKQTKPSALTRHKKWLNSFSGAVKQMQLDKAEKQMEDEDKDRRLRQKQAEQREMKRQILEANANASSVDGENVSPPPPAENNVENLVENLVQQQHPGEEAAERALPPKKKTTLESKTSSSMKKSKAKPKWAMTEEEALEADINEHDALIDFAEKLDFEKFLEDYEVREALAIMRDRVKEIAEEEGMDPTEAEKEDAMDDGDIDDGSSSIAPSIAPSNLSSTALEEWKAIRREKKLARARARKAKAAAEGGADDASDVGAGWNNSTATKDKYRSALTSDSMALAEKLLITSPSLAQIHTRHTLAKLLQDVTLKDMNELNTQRKVEGAGNVPVLPPVAPPVTATIAAESQATGQTKEKRVLVEMKKKKDHVQNLPYMYRCPSL